MALLQPCYGTQFYRYPRKARALPGFFISALQSSSFLAPYGAGYPGDTQPRAIARKSACLVIGLLLGRGWI